MAHSIDIVLGFPWKELSNGTSPKPAPQVKTDDILIQQVEELMCGESCHQAANLIGVYRGAARSYRETSDPDYENIAREAERELRILLTDLRLKRAVLVQWR